jgi:hypothetical protein
VKRSLLLVAIISALTAASGAGGYSIAQAIDVRPGGSALFLPQGWSCRNFGQRVACQSGDAYPWAELTGTRTGGVTVRVHTSSGAGVAVRVVRHPSIPGGPPANEIVYAFTAF